MTQEIIWAGVSPTHGEVWQSEKPVKCDFTIYTLDPYILKSIADELAEALDKLYEADRDFLGGDSQCVYCERPQHIGPHSDECPITIADAVLNKYKEIKE